MNKLVVLTFLLFLCNPLFAHSGRTNSQGCHNDRKSGSYHCHATSPKKAPATQPLKQPANLACGTKRYCKEMTSCQEARFYYNQCGLHQLDGDGDGVPCETLCR